MPKLRSQRVVMDGEVRPATIRHEGGVVVEVGDGPADDDFGDLVVLPGLVDSHVHVNEPGRTDWEGFASATAAAAAGGCTTIVDMPLNSVPPTVTTDALELKRSAASAQARVDVAFWGGIIPGSEGSIPDLVEEGVCGFKAFLVDSGVPEFPPVSIEELAKVAPTLTRPLLVHAEDPAAIEAPVGDPHRYATYLATRPGVAEQRAIQSLTPLAAVSHVHVLHVAGAEALEAIGTARREGRMTAETCPHYLTFDASSIPDGATQFKCAPPIRSRQDREALWEGLASGLIEMVVSDHSPAPPDLKDPAGGDFLQAWGGIASLELRLPATWDGARRRGHGVERLAEWLAAGPARLAGLAGAKGEIEVGGDADFVVFDPEGVTQVDAERLHQRHPMTPYDGMRLAGSVVATYLGGTLVRSGGAAPKKGRLLEAGG